MSSKYFFCLNTVYTFLIHKNVLNFRSKFYSSLSFNESLNLRRIYLFPTIFAQLFFVSILAVFFCCLFLISLDLSTFSLPFCLLFFFVYPLLAVALIFYSLFFFKKALLPFNLHLHTLYILYKHCRHRVEWF